MITKRVSRGILALTMAAAVCTWTVPAAAESLDSQRLARAKDYIADELWSRAIDELRAAVADPRERDRDEALFWLAHSQYQAGDPGSAVESISRLEREYPASRWVKPARSLRIEIAQRLHRQDVLWFTAVAPPAPAAPAQPAPPAPPAPAPRAGVSPTTVRSPRLPAPPSAVPPPALLPGELPVPPAPPAVWIPRPYVPDLDLRIQALSSLLKTDAPKVIPMLKEIALDSRNASEARSAVFVLAQSGQAQARETVVQVARIGPEPVRVAAVRELGRFGGPEISSELLQVYTNSTAIVKRQVVRSLGERADVTALQRIALSEVDGHLRDVAIVTLGTAGGRDQLRLLYAKASADVKRPIIIGLFNARAEDELIRIAEQERDQALRDEALRRLRLLGTPKARAYLEKVAQK